MKLTISLLLKMKLGVKLLLSCMQETCFCCGCQRRKSEAANVLCTFMMLTEVRYFKRKQMLWLNVFIFRHPVCCYRPFQLWKQKRAVRGKSVRNVESVGVNKVVLDLALGSLVSATLITINTFIFTRAAQSFNEPVQLISSM